MKPINPGGPTTIRRPSLRFVVMMDIVNGVERVRRWPKKRKKKLHPTTQEQVEWFRQAQFATKYWPPFMQKQHMEAVAGTPLMPRDIMTMVMANRLYSYTLPDGKVRYPMPAVQAVSESLDALAQETGAVLTRGTDLWGPAQGAQVGFVLTYMGADQPAQWRAASGGGGGAGWFGNRSTGSSGTGYACKGIVIRPAESLLLTGVRFAVSQSAGAIYRAFVCQMDGTTIASDPTFTHTVEATDTAARLQTFVWPAPIALDAGVEYWIGHNRTDATGATASGVHGGVDDPYGLAVDPQNKYGRLAQVTPALGQVIETGTNAYACQIGLGS